jgi:hypothetical protein
MSEEQAHHCIDTTWCRECFTSSFMINHNKLKVDVCFLTFIKKHHIYILIGVILCFCGYFNLVYSWQSM